jgi:quercetin dioxygenase-like cupin family protein
MLKTVSSALRPPSSRLKFFDGFQLPAAVLLLVAIDVSATQLSVVTVSPAGTQSSTAGSPKFFTGSVRIDNRFQGSGDARISGGTVTFEPGARSAWHTHPLGQTLIVTAGVGRVQQAGRTPQAIHPGDTVWIPPGVRHWHGATANSAMSHIAIVELLDGNSVEWQEQVSEEDYAKAQ